MITVMWTFSTLAFGLSIFASVRVWHMQAEIDSLRNCINAMVSGRYHPPGILPGREKGL